LVRRALWIGALVLWGIGAGIAAGPRPKSAPDDRRSGFLDMGAEGQALQRDDGQNPGMLSVLQGESLWLQPVGPAQRACATCHGADASSMRGVSPRYPKISSVGAKPVDLSGQINLCRTERQQMPAFRLEGADLLALAAYVAFQSRGMPIAPPDDPGLTPVREQGESLFRQRFGQLNLSCAACHDDNVGKRLGASVIPQAHPTGYPLYRLEWQALGSLQRRLRNCMSGVRAEPFAYGSEEFIALETYLMWRARGMQSESPAVRP
jgi:L-cysteine S-thiosulfotransferase